MMKIRTTFALGFIATSMTLSAQAESRKAGRPDTTFFNGKDLKGWSAGEMKYWSVKDGAIVGHSEANVPKNEFLWSDVEVKDFYLVVDVKLTPDNRNAGIQFRSKPINTGGQAFGYQADVGAGVWGKLYHEHGRGKLDWNNRAAKALKRGDWNHYEILAVGHRIWTAINGTLCVAKEDPKGELSGKIAFQIHGGPPQTVRYRVVKLVHNPEIALEKQTKKELLAPFKKQAEPATGTLQPKPGWTAEVTAWRAKLDANDPGMNGVWFEQSFDDSNWKTMPLPRHYERGGLPGHDGTAWFRRSIELPAAMAGRGITLELGPIDDMDMTWFNGTQVGGIERPGFWTLPRKYNVPGKLVKAGSNLITVRVIDHGWSGGFAGHAAQMKLSASGKKSIALAGEWRYRPGVTLKSLGLGPLTNPQQITVQAPAQVSVHPLLLPLAKPASPVPAFKDGFEISGDQTIAILGGANATESQRHGWLETHLVTQSKHLLQVRNMAWPADTVYQQQRPRNFFGPAKPGYGEKDRRPQLAVDVVVLWFGQMESLEGEAKLPAFTAAYEDILAQFAEYTGRLVLVTPVPFEDPLGLGFDLKKRNADLVKYASAIRKIAAARKLPLVDLFDSLRGKKLTTDGVLLSPRGHQLAAEAFARQLGLSPNLPANAESVRRVVLRKNELWRQYWLPTNWAFLYGNRQTQPSSRSHLRSRPRWFPEEVQSLLPQLAKLEQEIQNKARQR
jgi:hypothetical protein